MARRMYRLLPRAEDRGRRRRRSDGIKEGAVDRLRLTGGRDEGMMRFVRLRHEVEVRLKFELMRMR